MSRRKKALRNIVLIVILFFLFLNRTGLYLTPLSAHKNSERSAHYGPSKVVYIEDFEKGKHILGKYDKWVSCNTVNKHLLFFWSFGNQVHGFESDLTKAIDYSFGGNNEYYKFYGIRNNKDVNRIEIILNNGQNIEITDFHDDLFLITWDVTSDEEDDDGVYIRNAKAYDSKNNVIFDDTVH